MTPAARLAAQIAKMERERPDLPTARIRARLIAAAPDFYADAPRAAQMLRIAAEIIRENAPSVSHHYDEADCDGYCIADDCEAAADDLERAIAKATGDDHD